MLFSLGWREITLVDLLVWCLYCSPFSSDLNVILSCVVWMFKWFCVYTEHTHIWWNRHVTFQSIRLSTQAVWCLTHFLHVLTIQVYLEHCQAYYTFLKIGRHPTIGLSVGIEFRPPLFCFLLSSFEVSILSSTVCIFDDDESKQISQHPWLAVEGHYKPISLHLKLINSSPKELLTYNTIHMWIALLLTVLKPIPASPGHLRHNTSCSHSSSFM